MSRKLVTHNDYLKGSTFMNEKILNREIGESIKTQCNNESLTCFNVFLCCSAVIAMAVLIEPTSRYSYSELSTPTIYAHSNEALWVLKDCENSAELRYEDRVMRAQEKRNEDIDSVDTWRIIALGAVELTNIFPCRYRCSRNSSRGIL